MRVAMGGLAARAPVSGRVFGNIRKTRLPAVGPHGRAHVMLAAFSKGRGLMRHPELHRGDRIGWLRAAVLGANDGIVSTASLVIGVAAAHSTWKSDASAWMSAVPRYPRCP